MGKPRKGWCEICRDVDPDLFCSTRGCRRKFHVDCLRNTSQIEPDEDLHGFVCQVCKFEEQQQECMVCHKIDKELPLLICEVCNRATHMECIGLKEEPRSGEWFCETCAAKQPSGRTVMARVGGKLNQLGNVDICYVCQRGGKLLCCDLCDQSFHPVCIDPEFLDFSAQPGDQTKDESGEHKWGCPICRGQDPLKFMGHKRMTRTEICKRSSDWQKCVRVQSRKCKANRDQFLWNCRDTLKPFITPEVMALIKKNAAAAKSSSKTTPSAPAPVPRKRLKKDTGQLSAPPPPPPVPFKRTTSTSMRAALVREELEGKGLLKEREERPKRKKAEMADNHDSDNESHKLSRLSSDSSVGGRNYRRRLIEEDSDTEMPDVKVEQEKNDAVKENLQRMEASSSSATDGIVAKVEMEGKQPASSEVQPVVDQPPSSDQLTTPTVEEPKIRSVVVDDIDELPNKVAVSYQETQRLRVAEECAKQRSMELLKEGVSLKTYQGWGVNWLLDAFENKAGAILADEMGLGKTIQTLAFLSALKALGITGPHLVVVPLSTVGNWARELRRFTPHLTFTKICGSREEREHSISDSIAMAGIYDIFIVTYETAVTEEWFFTDQFKWQCVILDEAHRIKNESARIRHSLDRVDCNMRILLTGTPLQNNIKELFTLLNFLFPDIMRDSSVIQAAFQSKRKLDGQAPTEPKESSNGADRGLIDELSQFDEGKVESITGLLSNLMLRRTKDLVVRLPRKIDHDVWLPLSPAAARWYRRLLEITADFASTSIRKLLGAMIKMRICCCHPRGLVARDGPLQNIIENLKALGSSELSTVMDEVKQMKETDGWKHVIASSKLVFVDKLLCQLHKENYDTCPSYKEEYLTHQRNCLRKAVSERQEKLDALLGSSTEGDGHEAANRAIQKLTNEKTLLEGALNSGDEGLCKGLSVLDFPNESQAQYFDAMNGSTSESTLSFAQYLHPWKPTLDNIKTKAAETSGAKKSAAPVRPHKILIFTQFQLVLDELEAYCIWRGWSYMRLDGSTNKLIRELDTREFNNDDSNHFIFLISTRAGGLGINLVTANHVVLFDEDWNPWVDRQAIDRAHRIGQTRNVLVWRLTTEWSVEERMSIRRQQKLKLDRLLIQANVDNFVEEDLEPSDDKLSAEEIRRLIQYGKAALMEVPFSSGIEDFSLQDLMSRKRRKLQEVEEKTRAIDESSSTSVLSSPVQSEDSDPNRPPRKKARFADEAEDHLSVGTKESEMIDLEADDEFEEQGSVELPAVEGPDDGGVVNDNQSVNDDVVAAELNEKFELEARPRRERRRPKMLYNPLEWREKPKTERKIMHERKCFRCGDSGLVVQDFTSKDKNSKNKKNSNHTHTNDEDADPLVGCMRCPKAYHQKNCLGLEKMPPRSWMCPWHECCVCYRRAAAAGGLLIHCAECPTAFCFDCFPPEYRRYSPSPEYFENLRRYGWMVTAQKLVTFLCSRCKALKEQDRRRKLTKQQLDAENKSRRNREDSAKEEARKAQKVAKEAKQKEANSKKTFMAAKRKIDDSNKNLEEELRKAYEGLYAEKYLEFIKIRREKFVADQNAATKKVEEVVDAEAGATSAEEQQQQEVKRKTGKKRSVIPEKFKDLGATLKLCENCLLPRHSSAGCPFPQESVRRQAEEQEAKAKSAAAVPPPVLDTSAAASSDGSMPKGTEVSNDDALPTVAVVAKPKATRSRAVCSLCLKLSPPHTRRHCEQLTDADKDEYETRKAKVEKFVELLKAENGSVKPGGRLGELYMQPDFDPMSVDERTLDQARRQLILAADKILDTALQQAGFDQLHDERNHNKATVKKEATSSTKTEKKSKSSRAAKTSTTALPSAPVYGSITPYLADVPTEVLRRSNSDSIVENRDHLMRLPFQSQFPFQGTPGIAAGGGERQKRKNTGEKGSGERRPKKSRTGSTSASSSSSGAAARLFASSTLPGHNGMLEFNRGGVTNVPNVVTSREPQYVQQSYPPASSLNPGDGLDVLGRLKTILEQSAQQRQHGLSVSSDQSRDVAAILSSLSLIQNSLQQSPQLQPQPQPVASPASAMASTASYSPAGEAPYLSSQSILLGSPHLLPSPQQQQARSSPYLRPQQQPQQTNSNIIIDLDSESPSPPS